MRQKSELSWDITITNPELHETEVFANCHKLGDANYLVELLELGNINGKVIKVQKKYTKENNFFEDIRESLVNGEDFENEAADWYTLNRINKDGTLYICIRGENRWYKTINSYARRVAQLLKRGY